MMSAIVADVEDAYAPGGPRRMRMSEASIRILLQHVRDAPDAVTYAAWHPCVPLDWAAEFVRTPGMYPWLTPFDETVTVEALAENESVSSGLLREILRERWSATLGLTVLRSPSVDSAVIDDAVGLLCSETGAGLSCVPNSLVLALEHPACSDTAGRIAVDWLVGALEGPPVGYPAFWERDWERSQGLVLECLGALLGQERAQGWFTSRSRSVVMVSAAAWVPLAVPPF